VAYVTKHVSRRLGKQEGTVAGGHKLLETVNAVLKCVSPYTPDPPSLGPFSGES
jgi:hypothetical protein